MLAMTSFALPIRTRSAVCRACAALLLALVAACGGGGSDAGDTGQQSPIIATQPSDTSVVQGNSVTLRVVANGSSPLDYQWSSSSDGISFAAIGGATGDTHNTGTTTSAQNGTRYRVVVTNPIGSATSNVVRLTVTTP